MSYARFSTNAFRSHVYVYKHTSGHYQIDVASGEHKVDRSELPPPPDPDSENYAAQYAEHHRRVMDLVRGAEIVQIGGPMDGESFQEDTPEDTVERLLEIREAGYNVPDIALKGLRDETSQ